MKNRPQTIQIFLPDGNPRSIKIAELTNRVVKAVFVPRNKLEIIAKRQELNNVSVYFLFGQNEEELKPEVYIGETEDCLTRLKNHNREKNFWKYAVILISKTNAFTKGHVKFLEFYSIQQAIETNKYKLKNTSTPKRPFVTESMEADLIDAFETIKVLLSTLGYPIFDQIDKTQIKPKEILFLKAKGVIAEGDLTDDGFVIFKGSEASKKTTSSLSNGILKLRTKLEEDGTITDKGNNLVFLKDYEFNSPSQASDIIKGNSSNGWIEWKDKNGKTLDELKRK